MSYKREIPLWISEDEWRLVYTWLYSDDVETAKRGCARLQAWKARSTRAAIPFPLENTAELVQCRVSEATGVNSESLLQQAFAMAITRFVNGVCEYRYDQCKVKESVFVALHAMAVPSWVVILRHSATHVTMPSLTLLKSAAEFALKWLKENYWEKQITLISAVKQHDTSTEMSEELTHIKAVLKEHWENHILKALGKDKPKKKKKLSKAVNAIAFKLAVLSKRDLTELIHDGSFLVPNPSQLTELQLFELEDVAAEHLEKFPVLFDEINSMWSRPLHLMYKHNQLSISTITTILAEGVHDASLSHYMSSYMAAWLGKFFGDRYLDITKTVDWEELLRISYDKPGAYSYAIMKIAGDRLSGLNHPFVFSDQFPLLLESTRLLSAAERILPTIKAKGSDIFTPQDDYVINVNKLINETEEQKSDTTDAWKKSNALIDWRHVPLGLAPTQEVTATNLELPVHLDKKPTPAHGRFVPRLGSDVISSPVFESTIKRKRKFDQTDLLKIHAYCETLAKI